MRYSVRKRFALTRYFSLTSLMCTALIATALGWSYQELSLRDLARLAEDRNVALTHTFANALWPKFADLVNVNAPVTSDVLRGRAEEARLYDLVAHQMKSTNVVKLKVYALNGITVFSSDPRQTGEDKSHNAGFLTAREGEVASVLTHRDAMDTFEGTVADLDIISSYLPIRDDKAKIAGVIEIYSDVTAFVSRLEDTRHIILAIVFGLLALLYGLLYLLVRRAQGIIDRQESQLEASLTKVELANRELDARVRERTQSLDESNRNLRNEIEVRCAAEAQLTLAAEVFDNALEGMLITNADSVILRVNPAFTKITGYTPEEVVGQTPSLLQSGRHGPDFYCAMWESINRIGGWQGEIWGRRKNGEDYPKWLSIAAVKDEDGKLTHFIGTHIDITSRKQAEEKLNELAFFDQLTGVANRTLLLDRLKQAMSASSRSGNYGALLLIDLDHFKNLNDTLGHHMGDMLLKLVAQRLTVCVRESDTIARLGGDEFVVMLTGLSTDRNDAASQVEAVGEKVLDALNRPYELKDVAYRSTPSIGAALFIGQQPAVEVEVLLKQADLAMYKSKDEGGNALRFFDPEMEVMVMKRAALEKALQVAIEEKQLVLHYQAQVAGGRTMGAEALVRWQHPERGMVSPAEFIPLAEETGLILRLGRWVLETACRQLALWADVPEMEHLMIAVNVSARQFHQIDFVDQVLAVLKDTGANPRRLKMELTESLLVSNVEEVIDKMMMLKAEGVSFSLDDFGTGYSSLSYLKRLPLDQLKIDRSFVHDVLVDPNDAVIAQAIVALAHSLGLGVIAEGVETEAQRDFLIKVGCPDLQGFFFCRPLSVEEFEAFCTAALTPAGGSRNAAKEAASVLLLP
jgi:diguanylate cyclase (GGDEF)-like protein/PAS domain S-box-containing protein